MLKLIKSTKPSYIFNYACQSMVDESWEYPMDWFYTNSFNTINYTTVYLNLNLTAYSYFHSRSL